MIFLKTNLKMHILEINKKKILLGLPVDEFEFDKINFCHHQLL